MTGRCLRYTYTPKMKASLGFLGEASAWHVTCGSARYAISNIQGSISLMELVHLSKRIYLAYRVIDFFTTGGLGAAFDSVVGAFNSLWDFWDFSGDLYGASRDAAEKLSKAERTAMRKRELEVWLKKLLSRFTKGGDDGDSINFKGPCLSCFLWGASLGYSERLGSNEICSILEDKYGVP